MTENNQRYFNAEMNYANLLRKYIWHRIYEHTCMHKHKAYKLLLAVIQLMYFEWFKIWYTTEYFYKIMCMWAQLLTTSYIFPLLYTNILQISGTKTSNFLRHNTTVHVTISIIPNYTNNIKLLQILWIRPCEKCIPWDIKQNSIMHKKIMKLYTSNIVTYKTRQLSQ